MREKHIYSTRAYAKINLFLRVCGKLPNGYHRLFTLMQEVDIYDDIEVIIDETLPFSIELDCDGLTEDIERNLCYKAALRFYDKLRSKRRAERRGTDDFYGTSIKCIKNIPSEAGMGGGSSDAAAVIRILQEHYGNPLSQEELISMSVGLGADVPFFLDGGSAICEGVGEDIMPIETLSGSDIVVIKPAEGVSTAVCFHDIDYEPPVFDEDEYKSRIFDIFCTEKEAVKKVEEASSVMTNDLQTPAIKLVPIIKDLIDFLEEQGSIYAAMTGSGSAVFGVFEDSSAADKAAVAAGSSPLCANARVYHLRTI